MLSKYVTPGDRVEIQEVEKSTKSKNQEQKIYSTSVYDVLSDERLELLMPMEQTKLVLLPVDVEIDLCFYTKAGIYQCYAKIIERYKNNEVFILLLELSTSLRRHQRREYYRFNCILNMKSRALVKEEIKAFEEKGIPPILLPNQDMSLTESTIVDISGGGVRFISDSQYDNDTLICMTYHLLVQGKEKTYELLGKVLSSSEIENRKDQYEHRIQFVNIDNLEREEIIRFIFEEERKSRQRARGN